MRSTYQTIIKSSILLSLFFANLPALAVGPEYTVDGKGVHVKGVGPENPVIYDNDVCDDIVDAEYLLIKNSLGEARLVGFIGTPLDPDGKYHAEWFDTCKVPLEKAQAAGLKSVPVLTRGSETALKPPKSGVIEETAYVPSEGSELIVRQANQATPERPLLILLGGQANTVATAYLMDRSIRDRVMVMYTDGDGYNGGEDWAAYIVTQRLPVVHLGWKFWYDQTAKTSPEQWEVLPRPEEWKRFPKNPLTENIKNTLTHNGHYNGQWNVGHWDGYLDGMWMGIYHPACWQAAIKVKVKYPYAWEETQEPAFDVLEISAINGTAFKEEFMKTVTNKKAYGK